MKGMDVSTKVGVVNLLQNLIKKILVFLLIVPLLSGCWDRLEIEDRAVILAIGVDEAKPGDEKEASKATQILKLNPRTNKGLLRITVQIAVPGRIPLGTGSEAGSPSGEKPVWVLSSVGYTIEDCLMNLQQQLADRLFYGHLRVIQEGSVPYVQLKKESNIEISGLAYFRDDKMVGTSTALQIGHYMSIKEINPGGYSVMHELPSGTRVIFKATHRTSRITTTNQNGKVHVKINCQMEGDLEG